MTSVSLPISSEFELALMEHWVAVFSKRPEISLIKPLGEPTEKDLRESIWTTCRTDLSCSHDYFTQMFKKGVTQVEIRYKRHRPKMLYVRLKQIPPE